MHPTEDDFRLIPETTTHLSLRTVNLLIKGGFYTAEQIMMGSTAEFMAISGFGYAALGEVAAWRDALMAEDPQAFQEALAAVIRAMEATESVVTEKQAKAAMACIWGRIARGAFTASRVRQMLIDPTPANA
jgi:hypothetical protein